MQCQSPTKHSNHSSQPSRTHASRHATTEASSVPDTLANPQTIAIYRQSNSLTSAQKIARQPTTPNTDYTSSAGNLATAAQLSLDTSAQPTPITKLASKATHVLQPMAGAYHGFHSSAGSVTVGEKIASTWAGAIKEVDDVVVGAVAGLAVSGGTIAAAPFTGPAAPAVVASAPYNGATAGLIAGTRYDTSSLDKTFDSVVVKYAAPIVAKIVDSALVVGHTLKAVFRNHTE